MKTTLLTIAASALGGFVNAVPVGGSLQNLNQEVCARAGACGHTMDCNELWLSCNLKLLLAGKSEFSEDGGHPDLGYMIPWWYQGMGMTM
ncbi:hypothetical protein E0Z10_g10013 [Xylaria hypoxylon]|uniref:CBM1 domain-containing protein n=1 Tax=Xylaria hypoxylon TaxID=37992 RepID=A0A4Z0YII7_9PEZI|nr:hypothetical protein E0Z10_g10013 [Xylaria hypoxylon]